MKFKTRLLAIALVLSLFAIPMIAGVSAQHSHDHKANQSWKKGMVRLTRTAWAENIRLERGMYHVKHVIEGDRHWLVFKAVTLRAGYQEGFMWEGKEVARLECRVEPAERSLRNTKVTLAKNEGAYVIEQVQIARENVRHVLAAKSSV